MSHIFGLNSVGQYHVAQKGHNGYGESVVTDIKNDVSNSLERVPEKDCVNFAGKPNQYEDIIEVPLSNIAKNMDSYQFDVKKPKERYNASKMFSQNGLDLNISNGFWGMSNRTVKGKLGNLDVKLKFGDNMLNHSKGSIKGEIGDKKFDLEYKVKNDKVLILKGKGIESCDANIKSLLSVLAYNNIQYNIERDN